MGFTNGYNKSKAQNHYIIVGHSTEHFCLFFAKVGFLIKYIVTIKGRFCRAASWENHQCCFRTGPTQTDLYKRRKELEALNIGFKWERNCTIREAKTKALISFAVTAKLICVFVFAYADCWFSHEAAKLREGLAEVMYICCEKLKS